MLLSIKDIIDILLVAILLFAIYRVLRRSGASNLFWGILAFILAWLSVNYIFHLELTGALFDRFVSVGAIALIVIFQEEIRGFFYRLGSRLNIEHFKNRWSKMKNEESIKKQAAIIVKACKNMSATQTGALIVITQQQELNTLSDTGEKIDAVLSSRLIENIFFKNSPLHDGAMIIHDNTIWSAACILPVSKRTDLPKHYGLRHRAALGITEKTDAIAIIVSEEKGTLSFARENTIKAVTPEELENLLNTYWEQSEK